MLPTPLATRVSITTHVWRKFYSAIMVNQKNNFLGYHDTPQEAHAAYIRAAKEYFGEFSRAA